MALVSGLPIFVDEVPEYEARGDHMVLKWRGLEVFVPIHTCMAAMEQCERALQDWRVDQSGKVEGIEGH